MPAAHVNGIDVHDEQRASGPRLLFVNGSGSSLAAVRPMLDRYAEHFEVLAHDQRGLGATEIPPGHTTPDLSKLSSVNLPTTTEGIPGT